MPGVPNVPHWCAAMMDLFGKVDRVSVELALEGYRVNGVGP